MKKVMIGVMALGLTAAFAAPAPQAGGTPTSTEKPKKHKKHKGEKKDKDAMKAPPATK